MYKLVDTHIAIDTVCVSIQLHIPSCQSINIHPVPCKQLTNNDSVYRVIQDKHTLPNFVTVSDCRFLHRKIPKFIPFNSRFEEICYFVLVFHMVLPTCRVTTRLPNHSHSRLVSGIFNIE